MLSNSKTNAALNTKVLVTSNSNPSIIVSTEIQGNLEIKDQNVPNEQKFPFTSSDMVDKYVYKIKVVDENNNSNQKTDLNNIMNKFEESKASKRKEAKASCQEYKLNINYKPASDVDSNYLDENNNKVNVTSSNNFYSNNGACNGGIKRGCEDVDGETEDDLITLSSSSLGHNKRSPPPKKPKFVVTYKEMREFFTLLNEESIKEFLKRDICCLISDKVFYC
jgi:hypothetical protein